MIALLAVGLIAFCVGAIAVSDWTRPRWRLALSFAGGLLLGAAMAIQTAPGRANEAARAALIQERNQHARTIVVMTDWRERYQGVAGRLCEHIRMNTLRVPAECEQQ